MKTLINYQQVVYVNNFTKNLKKSVNQKKQGGNVMKTLFILFSFVFLNFFINAQTYQIENAPFSQNVEYNGYIYSQQVPADNNNRWLRAKLVDAGSGSLAIYIVKSETTQSNFKCSGHVVLYRYDGSSHVVYDFSYSTNCNTSYIYKTVSSNYLHNSGTELYYLAFFTSGSDCDGYACVGGDGENPSDWTQGLNGNPHIIGAWRVTVQNPVNYYISVQDPNSNSDWKKNDSYNITWNDNIDENVKIQLFKGSDYVLSITNSTSSDGLYYWSVLNSLQVGNDYRIKIISVSNSSVYAYSDYFTISSDYSISNDNSCSAQYLSVKNYVSYSTYSNVGSSASSGFSDPSCGGYRTDESTGDVWFKFIVPSSGYVGILFNSISGEPSDWATEVYSYNGSCSNLSLLECDDDDGPGTMPEIHLTDLNSGSWIYVRVWEYGCNQSGNFKISIVEENPPTFNLYSSNIIIEPNPLEKGEPADINVTVFNNGDADFSGNVYLSLHDINGNYITDIVNENITLSPNSSYLLQRPKKAIISDTGKYKIIAKYYDENSNSYVVLREKNIEIKGINIDYDLFSDTSYFVDDTLQLSFSVKPDLSRNVHLNAIAKIFDSNNKEVETMVMDSVGYDLSNNEYFFDKKYLLSDTGHYYVQYLTWFDFSISKDGDIWYVYKTNTDKLKYKVIYGVNIVDRTDVSNFVVQDITPIVFSASFLNVIFVKNYTMKLKIITPSNDLYIFNMNMLDSAGSYYFEKTMSSSGNYKYSFLMIDTRDSSIVCVSNEKNILVKPRRLIEDEWLNDQNIFEVVDSNNICKSYLIQIPKDSITALDIIIRQKNNTRVKFLVKKFNTGSDISSFYFNNSDFDPRNNYIHITIDSLNTAVNDNLYPNLKLLSRSEKIYIVISIYPKDNNCLFDIKYEALRFQLPLYDKHQKWDISHGYNDGSHLGDKWRYSLDFNLNNDYDFGIPVFACEDGFVNLVFDKPDGTNGRAIEIKHYDFDDYSRCGYRTLYMHLSSIAVHRKQYVHKGQIIGFIGNTGLSSGAHLHYTLRKGKTSLSVPSEPMFVGNVMYPNDFGYSNFFDEGTLYTDKVGLKRVFGAVDQDEINSDYFIISDPVFSNSVSFFGNLHYVNKSGLFNSFYYGTKSDYTETNAFRWRINRSGRYKVYVAIPKLNRDLKKCNVLYKIFHSDGITCVSVDQNKYSNYSSRTIDWVYLGTYNFNSNIANESSVRLGNNSIISSNNSSYNYIVYDAIVFVKDSSGFEPYESGVFYDRDTCNVPLSSTALSLTKPLYFFDYSKDLKSTEKTFKIYTGIRSNEDMECTIYGYLYPDSAVYYSNGKYYLDQNSKIELFNIYNSFEILDTVGVNTYVDINLDDGRYLLSLEYNYNSNNNKTIVINDSVYRTQFWVDFSNSLYEYDNNTFIIYPNPATDYVYIKSEFEFCHIDIYDVFGRIIKKYDFSNTYEKNIDISDISSGIYVIKIGNKTLKLFVQ